MAQPAAGEFRASPGALAEPDWLEEAPLVTAQRKAPAELADGTGPVHSAQLAGPVFLSVGLDEIEASAERACSE